MSDKYVNNAKTGVIYDQLELSESIGVVNGSDLITDVAASLVGGQCVQLDAGTMASYRIAYISPYQLDRNFEDATGTASMEYSYNDGESEEEAYPNINQALDEAVSGEAVYVKWTSTGYLLTNVDQIATVIEPGVGSLLSKPIILEGYHTTVGDMRYGGLHYQSPLHAKVFGIDTTKKVTISGEDALASLLTLNSSDFIIIRNFYFKDATGLIVALANTPANVFFEHCIFADSGSVLNGACNGFGFYDCYIKGMDYIVSSYTINCGGTIGAKFIGNVLDIGNYTKYGFSTGSAGYDGIRGLHYGNLIIGGLYPALARAGDTMINNTIYDSLTCIRLGFGGQWTPVTIRNNIIVAKTAADKGILIAGSTAGAIINDNNCFWSLDGTPITNPITNDVPGGGSVSIGVNSIEVDPMLTSDYRPREPKVLRGGNADIYGNAGQIGAVLSEHKFQRRPAGGRSTSKRFFR